MYISGKGGTKHYRSMQDMPYDVRVRCLTIDAATEHGCDEHAHLLGVGWRALVGDTVVYMLDDT
jgi:hypothetical protein